MRPLGGDALAGLTPYDELLVPSAAVAMISAVFWRSRFKYGARAYRFALLEAGHVAQNFLLAATALALAACPVGGFFDRRVDAFLGIDGLYEASLYLLPVGARGS
jgi:SagB-type dehydrogenase family enzyme